VQASGGLDYAKTVMERYSGQAFSILETFPDSPARQALRELVVYVTQRKK
jgi:octaprenyl-diphosphate synthase